MDALCAQFALLRSRASSPARCMRPMPALAPRTLRYATPSSPPLFMCSPALACTGNCRQWVACCVCFFDSHVGAERGLASRWTPEEESALPALESCALPQECAAR
eukprot:1334719-Pleurochrysis_carterae.AAC.1